MVSLSYTPLNENLFLRGFLKDLYLRPSCYSCPTKRLKSESDITLGDYWGINMVRPELDDDMGISAVTVNSEKGKDIFHRLELELHDMPWEDLIAKNPALVESCAIPLNRNVFFENDGKTFSEKIILLTKESFSLKRFVKKAISMIKRSR